MGFHDLPEEPAGRGIDYEIPQWQKDLLDYRRGLINIPGHLIPVDEFLEQMEREADEEDFADDRLV